MNGLASHLPLHPVFIGNPLSRLHFSQVDLPPPRHPQVGGRPWCLWGNSTCFFSPAVRRHELPALAPACPAGTLSLPWEHLAAGDGVPLSGCRGRVQGRVQWAPRMGLELGRGEGKNEQGLENGARAGWDPWEQENPSPKKSLCGYAHLIT